MAEARSRTGTAPADRLIALVTFLTEQPPESWRMLPVEEVALCATWRNATKGDPALNALGVAAMGVVNAWMEQGGIDDTETEGGRQQPLLRQLVSLLKLNGAESMQPAEADFLCWCDAIMARAQDPEMFARPRGLLAPFLPVLVELRDYGAHPTLLPLLDRVRYVTPEELADAPKREVGRFGGVAVKFRGHLLGHKGTIKILGDVPENCAVAAEGGTCTVRGAVLGLIAATDSCDVNNNLAGTAIANRGEVRLRNLLFNSIAISKQGAVRAMSAERPQLVYANERILLRGRVRGGTFIAPEIHVEQEVLGGVFHVTGKLDAKYFTSDEKNRLHIVFRRNLSCEDYGEDLSGDARRLLRQGRQLRNRREETQRLIRMMGVETDHFAQNALVYLLGGGKANDELQRVESAQRRLSFLDRVVAGIDELIESVEDRLAAGRQREEDASQRTSPSAADAPEENGQSLILDELEKIDEDLDSDLQRGREELLRAQRDLVRSRRDIKLANDVLRRLHDQRHGWSAERAQLRTYIATLQENIDSRVGRITLLEQIKNEVRPVNILQQLLGALKKRTPTEAEKKTLAQPYMQVSLRHVQTRLRRIQDYINLGERLENEHREVLARLRDQYNVILSSSEEIVSTKGVGPSVTGAFSADVVLYADLFLYTEQLLGSTGVYTTTPNSGEVQTYARSDNNTVIRTA